MNKFSLWLFGLIILLFIIFEPRIPSLLFVPIRSYKLNQLVENIQTNGVNTREFWKTREFYYPGNFIVHKESLTEDDVEKFLKYSGINIPSSDTYSILIYTSNKWYSYEALVNSSSLKNILTIPIDSDSQFILNTDNTIIMKSSNKTYIIFLATIEDLRLTNGFINRDYEITDKYTHWLSVSVITE